GKLIDYTLKSTFIRGIMQEGFSSTAGLPSKARAHPPSSHVSRELGMTAMTASVMGSASKPDRR
ncbi:hypothetical protein, partial [Rhizobium johnstonii]|uniref:hypothetical protein n=1 Tax=Rhizobium johnstonii TaxID=3019933 RepID=UPI003F986839